jgi:hypothetical protein
VLGSNQRRLSQRPLGATDDREVIGKAVAGCDGVLTVAVQSPCPASAGQLGGWRARWVLITVRGVPPGDLFSDSDTMTDLSC